MQADLTLWILLGVIIAGFLFLDLFVFHVAKELVDIREEGGAPAEDPIAAEEARAAALDQAALSIRTP